MKDAPLQNDFDRALAALPEGYSEGLFQRARWGTTVKRSADGRRTWLFAEDLSGSDIVSFNLYRLGETGGNLKPCEMSSEKVIEFVLGFESSNERKDRRPTQDGSRPEASSAPGADALP